MGDNTQAVVTQKEGNALSRGLAYTKEQVDLIKATCAQDATDDELNLFLHFCKESGVDPLRKQAHFVVRRYKDRNGNWQRSNQMIVGIDGFRKRAEEQPDFLGIRSSAVYAGENIELDYGKGEVSYKVNPLNRKPKAVVGAFAVVHRKNRTAHIEWIDWTEYKDERSPMHRDKPAVMAKKTAEATALRHEYPDKFSGMYAPEEMPSDYHVPALMTDGDEAPKQVEAPKPEPVAVEAEYVDNSPPADDPNNIPFDELEGMDPSLKKNPVEQVQKAFDGEIVNDGKKDRNIPYEIRKTFGGILSGCQTALGVKFSKQQASDFLGQIMLSLDIPAMDYTEDDGLIHTSGMTAAHADKLILALSGPNALDRFKKLAQSKVLPPAEDSQTPNDDSENSAVAEQESLPIQADTEKIRKNLAETQKRIAKEFGSKGMMAAVDVIKNWGLDTENFTVEDLKAADAEMGSLYVELLKGN